MVGALLMGIGLAALLWAIFRRAWSASLPARRAAAGLTGAAGVVLGQALVDWIWLIPGVMGIGLFCLALAVVTVTPRPPTPPRLGLARGRTTGLLRGLPAAGLLASALLVAAMYLGDFQVGEARGDARSDPAGALEHAHAAQALTPWAVAPHYLAAGALESTGQPVAARIELRRALRLAPGSFVTHALMGDLERRQHDRPAAHVRYRRAHRANPRDTGLRGLVKKTRPQAVKSARKLGRWFGSGGGASAPPAPKGFATPRSQEGG